MSWSHRSAGEGGNEIAKREIRNKWKRSGLDMSSSSRQSRVANTKENHHPFSERVHRAERKKEKLRTMKFKPVDLFSMRAKSKTEGAIAKCAADRSKPNQKFS